MLSLSSIDLHKRFTTHIELGLHLARRQRLEMFESVFPLRVRTLVAASVLPTPQPSPAKMFGAVRGTARV